MLAELRSDLARARSCAPAGYARGRIFASRRGPAALLLGLAILLGVHVGSPAPARAQQAVESEPEPRRDRSYLIQLGFTLEGVRRLTLWIETHPNDPELARYAYPLSERYVELAGHMTPSKRLSTAHPHLLLVVENVERALDAAGRNDMDSFRKRMRTVREELAILDNVLKQLKLKLPEMMR